MTILSQETRPDDPQPQVLSEILLIQNMLSTFEDPEAMLSFACRGLEDLPGVGGVRYICAEEFGPTAQQPDAPTPADEQEKAHERAFAVRVGDTIYADIFCTVNDGERFRGYEPYVHNICFMIAARLQERRHVHRVEDYRRRLEHEVETRTADLKAARLQAEAERARAQKYLNVTEAIVVELDREGNIDRLNARGKELLGYPAEAPLQARNWFELAVPPEARARQEQEFTDRMAGYTGVQEYADREIVTRDGGRRFVHWHTVIRRHADGSVAGILASGQDVTERRNAEREKEVLLKEVHHRTKNNMQVIISLLALQVRRTRSDAVRTAMTDAQNRIMSMALVHSMLYESKNLAQMPLKSYITELAGTILAGYSPGGARIGLHVTGKEVPVNMETAVQCGLVLNEIITNTAKHAFADGVSGDPQVEVDLGCSAGEIVLRYRDNGSGFPEDFNPVASSGVGMQVVTSVIRDQLYGSYEFNGDNGAEITVRFPQPACGSEAGE